MALIPSKAGLELLRSPSPDLAGRRSSRLQGIVEDVLREGGVLTTDEIYCGVKAKHVQLRYLLPPRWQEKVRQILEAYCISHDGNSWFLENIEQLEERPECEVSLFDPHGISKWIIDDSNRGQKRTDWLLGTFLSALRQLRRVVNWVYPRCRWLLGTFLSGLRRVVYWVYPRGRGPVWRLWQLGQAGRDEARRKSHSPERALHSTSSIRRTSSKMPETFESALRFDEGVVRAPSMDAPRPAARAVANRSLGLTGHFDRLSEQELRDRMQQSLEKLGLLLSDRPKDGKQGG
jgi:hypothetical protein